MTTFYKKLVTYLLCLICLSGLCACGVDKNNSNELEENNSELQEEIKIEQTDWVANLQVARETTQILTVVAENNTAVVSLHEKEDGIWKEIITTQGYIGKNGIGKSQEGDGKTPKGKYHFTFAFGIKDNPGCNFEYTQVDESYYWVDDSESQYYNQFVSTKIVEIDWLSAEHILSAEESYHYVLATDYNAECEPGRGSAIFMHCLPTGGAGCIAIPEDKMVQMLEKIRPECVIIIDEETEMVNY